MYGYVLYIQHTLPTSTKQWHAIVSEQLMNESRSCWVMNFYRILCMYAYGVKKNLIGDVMHRKHLMVALAHTNTQHKTVSHIIQVLSSSFYMFPHLSA